MKKLLLLGAATLLAGAANAADWYLCGGAYGWNDGSEYKFVQSATNANEYTLDLSTKTKKTLEGEIKIKETGTWSTSFGTNGSKLQAGKSYTANKDGGNINVDGTIENAVITINTQSYTIFVTGQSKENEYSVVYLMGDFGSGWNEDITNYPLTLKSGTTNTYEGEYTLTAATTYFKMKAGALVYGTGGNDIAISLGTTYTAAQSGNAFSITPGTYKFTYVLNKNAATGQLTVTQEGPVTYPDEMYLIGNVNLLGWKANNGIKMTTVEEGVYTLTATLDNEMDASAGYFSFTAGLGANADDWSGMGIRYGATASDTAVTLGETYDVIYGENAFKMAGGKYVFNLNLKEGTVKVTEPAVEPEPPFVAPEAPATINATYNTAEAEGTVTVNEENNYTERGLTFDLTTEKEELTISLDIPEGFNNFFLIDLMNNLGGIDNEPLRTRADLPDGWYTVEQTKQIFKQSMGADLNAEEGHSFTVKANGEDFLIYAFLVKDGYVNTNVRYELTGKVTCTKEPEPQPVVMPKAPETISCTYDTEKVFGTVTTNEEDINTERGLTFDLKTTLEEVTINLNIPEGFDNFFLIDLMDNLGGIDNEPLMTRAEMPDGWYTVEQTKQIFKQSMGTDLTAEVGHSFTVKADGEDFMVYAFLVKDGYVNTNVRYELTGVIESIESGVAAIEANGVAEYYTLEGVKVSNPEKGLYIKVEGSKVSKVLVK